MLKNIIIIGYMAAGKSAIAALLAKKLGLKHLDLDNYIQEKTALSISEIFKTKGEVYFRKLESAFLKEILTQKTPFILAVGGGTPTFGDNMNLMNQLALTIYLDVPQKVLVARLQAEKQNRPLVADLKDETIAEFVAKHLFERRVYYEQSQLKIKTESKTMPEIVALIIKEIEAFKKT